MSGPAGGVEGVFSSKWFDRAAAGVIAVAVLIAYSNTFGVPFTFDDMSIIVGNRRLQGVSGIPSLLLEPRGLTLATFALNYAAGGYSVAGYHAVNVAVHAANGVLAYLFLTRLFSAFEGKPSARRLAFFAALIFAVHPIQTQAVTYIVQRMESLQALFYLAALLCFQRSADAKGPGARYLLYAAVVACYVLAFKSKEVGITLPATVLLYDLFFVSGLKPRETARRWPLYAALFAVMAYFAYSTIAPAGGFGDPSREAATASQPAPHADATKAYEAGLPVVDRAPTAGFGVRAITPKEYLLTQMNVIVYYVSLIIMPANQNIDYDFPVSRGLFEAPTVHEGTVLNYPIPMPAVSLAILLAVSAAALYLLIGSAAAGGATMGRAAAYFIFWFFIILSPTSSFIPIVDVIFEHRVYLASLGAFAVAVIVFESVISRVMDGAARRK